MWLQLERPAAGPDESAAFSEKLEAMTSARTEAGAGGLPAIDVIVLIIGLCRGWFLCPAGLLGADGSDPASPARLAAHRAALVEAVRRMCAPTRDDAVSAPRTSAG